jgi:predicted regulator of Ras-like GTPase activity (Roadblock/LC7/MglB family)
MPFQYLLTNLLVDVPGAQGAVFLDSEGETVECVTRKSTPYELKLEGAYHGIFLRRAVRLVQAMGGGEPQRIDIAGTQLFVMSRPLKGGYYLVLVMDPGAPIYRATSAMQRAGVALDREIP